MKLRDRVSIWTHWRSTHKKPSSKERHEDYAGYVNALSGKRHGRDVSYSDIQCQKCNEISGRLRIPKSM